MKIGYRTGTAALSLDPPASPTPVRSPIRIGWSVHLFMWCTMRYDMFSTAFLQLNRMFSFVYQT
eukprot:scaffold27683_cov59-Attheya_sp.AAC.8